MYFSLPVGKKQSYCPMSFHSDLCIVRYNSLNRNTELHSHYERSDIAEAPRHLHHSGLVRRQFFSGPPA